MESTKAAREARKANRDRERAALVLQSAIRGWLTRIRIEKDVRQNVDKAIEGDSDKPTAVEMYRMTRNFMTFCKPRKDTERLEKICMALVSSLVSFFASSICHSSLRILEIRIHAYGICPIIFKCIFV